MAKTTRKTESTPAEKKPVVRRTKAASPAAGAAKPAVRPAKKAAGEAPAAAVEPTHDEISLRAWSIYESRGGGHGEAMDDWLEARRQLVAERGLRA